MKTTISSKVWIPFLLFLVAGLLTACNGVLSAASAQSAGVSTVDGDDRSRANDRLDVIVEGKFLPRCL